MTLWESDRARRGGYETAPFARGVRWVVANLTTKHTDTMGNVLSMEVPLPHITSDMIPVVPLSHLKIPFPYRSLSLHGEGAQIGRIV